MKHKYTLQLSSVGLDDISNVGGKNASLGEMLLNLSPKGISVPEGFLVTVDSFRLFIESNGLTNPVKEIIERTDFTNIAELRRNGMEIRYLMMKGKMPEPIEKEVIEQYHNLSQSYGQKYTDVAVRSSATAEDLPDASFAGQQETYLNVRGEEALLNSIKSCFASLFTDRAIVYREGLQYDHLDIGLSVGIQKMVRSDLGKSGVAFSIDTESGFKDVVLINAAYGLGEHLVQGKISPDEYLVFKPSLQKGYPSIIEKKLGNKFERMVYSSKPNELTKIIPVNKKQQNQFCLNDLQVLQLANWVCIIEEYYSDKYNRWCPVDVEWAIDGLTNDLFIVQARPETIHSRITKNKIVQYEIKGLSPQEKRLLEGIAVGDKIGIGKVKILTGLDARNGSSNPDMFEKGDILVTEMTDPDWEPIMKIASAIVTNKGGRTCHAAIVARELGIPAIVGTESATDVLENNQTTTVSCAEGNVGYVYDGELKYDILETDINQLPKVKTPLMLNVASPEMAFKFSHLPNCGVGLAREEFIINNYIQVHPLALLRHEEIGDKELSAKIKHLTRGYADEEEFFINKLSNGIAKIGAAFYPNEVIVRFSDFKSNEYANLLGGKYFEPNEENPMIGWRGASRYYSEQYKEAFGLECKSILKVREEMDLRNVVVMIPFCRTVYECTKVLDTMKEFGLEKCKNGLKIYLMAELPSNVVLANEFAKYVDGFSIGSNDLTQLTLGLDRDSHLVSHVYDERNEAVKKLIRDLIKVGKETGIKVGICGQAPSDFPDFAEFLVDQGIDSISVTPDSILKTLLAIDKIERHKGLNKQ
jgi:pyruvate,water dikinase